MRVEDYQDKIALFYEANPLLTREELAVVLTADLLYKNTPEDLGDFRKKYAHLDPTRLTKSTEGITFLKIAREKKPAKVLRDRLNDYLNVKFQHIKRRRSYAANAVIFKRRSIVSSQIIEELLGKAAFPKEIQEVLREREVVRDCYDFYEMLKLFKKSKSEQLRFEILRKIGLIVLIARIDRTVEPEELEDRKKEVWEAFHHGLRKKKMPIREYFLWLNAKHKVDFTTDADKAHRSYEGETETRRKQACRIFPLQKFRCRPFTTPSGNEILHMEIRSKLGTRTNPSYASYVEKMVRKNLEFPNQVHDTIGIKIVVEQEDQIATIIGDLETFLGGSSTRKMEKNSYHRFGKSMLSGYSSPEYFVWKAIYDMTLPHASISHVKKMLKLTRGNPSAQEELRSRLKHFADHPSDFVIEVQLQDIRSYLLSIAKGSPTAHAWLKMNQVRSNSFYKFFPREIYGRPIQSLKLGLLSRNSD